MSALPRKEDMCAVQGHVCFGPKADIARIFDHLVGDLLEMHWHVEAQRLGGLDVDNKLKLRRHLHWQITRLLALEDASLRKRNQHYNVVISVVLFALAALVLWTLVSSM